MQGSSDWRSILCSIRQVRHLLCNYLGVCPFSCRFIPPRRSGRTTISRATCAKGHVPPHLAVNDKLAKGRRRRANRSRPTALAMLITWAMMSRSHNNNHRRRHANNFSFKVEQTYQQTANKGLERAHQLNRNLMCLTTISEHVSVISNAASNFDYFIPNGTFDVSMFGYGLWPPRSAYLAKPKQCTSSPFFIITRIRVWKNLKIKFWSIKYMINYYKASIILKKYVR